MHELARKVFQMLTLLRLDALLIQQRCYLQNLYMEAGVSYITWQSTAHVARPASNTASDSCRLKETRELFLAIVPPVPSLHDELSTAPCSVI